MNLELRALGLGLLAAVAISAGLAASAGANGEGHFVTDLAHTDIEGFVSGDHKLHFSLHGMEDEVGCNTHYYTATPTTATTTSITVTPHYEECVTTSNGIATPIEANGCTYTFTVAKGTTDKTEQTAHLLCPAGQKIEILHLNCTIDIHPQTISSGITYTRKEVKGVHYITLDAAVQVTTTRHGPCQFILPTNGVSTLSGFIVVRAFKPKTLAIVNVTAT